MSKLKDIWGSVERGEGLAWDDEREIHSLIQRAAGHVDTGRFVDFAELFTAEGRYAVITNENLETGLFLLTDIGEAAFRERAAYHLGIWQVKRGKLTHLVTTVAVSKGDDGNPQALSNFLITRTGDLEHSKLHASGQYFDKFEKVDGDWRFTSRDVIIDSTVLPGEFTDLL